MRTKRWTLVVFGLALLCLASPRVLRGGDAPSPAPRLVAGVWDTGTPVAEALPAAAFEAKAGWTQIATDQTAESFKGDAVVTNGRRWMVLRKQAAAADVYAANADGAVWRGRLVPLSPSGEPAARWERMALIENTKGGAVLNVAGKTEKGASLALKFALRRDETGAAEADPGPGAGRLRIECPSEFVVLPDFFADDIVINPRKLPLAQVEVPSENFVLHLAGKQNSIAMCVFENRQQDAKLLLSGEGDKRAVAASDIAFGEPAKETPGSARDAKAPAGRRIWLALLEGPKIWHTREVQTADAGKIMPLEWKMPMPAQWRLDFTRPDGLVDSWEMLLQEKADGDYVKPGWLGSGPGGVPKDRKRWTTVLGSFPYPCWSDADGQAYIQPLKDKPLSFQGPLVVYPINHVKQTPLDASTVVSVVRNTLGVGPCEYILDVENQQSRNQGRATCSTRDTLVPIYKRGAQKAERAKIEKTLDEALVFVKYIRSRITRYVDFCHKMREYLAEQKKARPELAEPIADLDKFAQQADARFAAREKDIKTPEHVAAMNEEFRKNILDDTGPKALEKCTAYAKALVVIGGSQDELAGECRWVVKALRQRAGILMALDARVAPLATEIRARTQEVLRSPAGHEGARH